MHYFYVSTFEGMCTSLSVRADSCYWIIDNKAFSPSYNLASFPFPPSPILQKAQRTTHRKTKKERQLADERGGSSEHFFRMVNMVHFFFFFSKLTSCHPTFHSLIPKLPTFSFPTVTLLPSYLSVFNPQTTTFFLSNSDPPAFLPFNH
jgi:hypothetical protein